MNIYISKKIENENLDQKKYINSINLEIIEIRMISFVMKDSKFMRI